MATHRPSRGDEPRRDAPAATGTWPPPAPPVPSYQSPARLPAAPPPWLRVDDGEVVPLEPYGAGVIFRGMGRTIRRAPAQLAAAALLAFAISAAVGVAFGRLVTITRTDDASTDLGLSTPVRTYSHRYYRGEAALSSLAVVAAVVVAAVVVPVVLGLVAGRAGRDRAPRRSGARAGAAALVLAIVALPQTLLAAEQVPLLFRLPVIGVTVWIATGFALAPATAAAESLGPVAACRRSWQLVRGSWWRVFGLSLLFEIASLISGAIAGGYGAVAVLHLQPGASLTVLDHPLAVLFAAPAAIAAPMVAMGRTLLYVDLRSRAEGLAWSLDAARRGDDRELFGPGGVYGVPAHVTATGAPSGW